MWKNFPWCLLAHISISPSYSRCSAPQTHLILFTTLSAAKQITKAYTSSRIFITAVIRGRGCWLWQLLCYFARRRLANELLIFNLPHTTFLEIQQQEQKVFITRPPSSHYFTRIQSSPASIYPSIPVTVAHFRIKMEEEAAEEWRYLHHFSICRCQSCNFARDIASQDSRWEVGGGLSEPQLKLKLKLNSLIKHTLTHGRVCINTHTHPHARRKQR